jgi:hypothetical protein
LQKATIREQFITFSDRYIAKFMDLTARPSGEIKLKPLPHRLHGLQIVVAGGEIQDSVPKTSRDSSYGSSYSPIFQNPPLGSSPQIEDCVRLSKFEIIDSKKGAKFV